MTAQLTRTSLLIVFASLNACAVANVDEDAYNDSLYGGDELDDMTIQQAADPVGTGGTPAAAPVIDDNPAVPLIDDTMGSGGTAMVDDAMAADPTVTPAPAPVDTSGCDELALNVDSGSFGTTGELCFTAAQGPTQAWNAYNFTGRAITINGETVSAGQMPWPGSAPYTITFSAGDVDFTSWSYW